MRRTLAHSTVPSPPTEIVFPQGCYKTPGERRRLAIDTRPRRSPSAHAGSPSRASIGGRVGDGGGDTRGK